MIPLARTTIAIALLLALMLIGTIIGARAEDEQLEDSRTRVLTQAEKERGKVVF
jgi:hypothetical protein